MLSDIKEIPPVYQIPPFALTGILLLLSGIVVYIFLRRNKLRDHPKQTEDNINAIDRLKELTSDYNHGGLSAEALFCRLAELIADTLVTPIRTASQTTDEILDAIAVVGGATSEQYGLASNLLKMCDQVKFAGCQPVEQEINKALASAATLFESLPGETE